MAYLLRFDGVNDNVDLASPISASGDGVLAEIDFEYQGASNDVICGGTSFSDFWRINNDAQFRISISGSAANVTINTPLVSGTRYTLRLVRTGSSVVVEDENGTAITPATTFNDSPFVIDKIGSFHNGSSNLAMDLYGFKANNGANVYDPTASNGTGSILPDTEGGNNGTLVSFPTDNSQWIYDPTIGAIEPTEYYLNTNSQPAPVVVPYFYGPTTPTQGQTLVLNESVLQGMSVAEQDAFWNNVESTGGDLRLTSNSDGTGRLPLELVSIDTTARTFVLWYRLFQDYDGIGNAYLWFGKAEETQPPVTDPFGRNAVWVDYNLVIHQGSTIDSTGNHAPFLVGSPSLSPMQWSGQGYDLDTNSKWIQIPHSSSLNIGRDYTIQLWYDGKGTGSKNGTAYVDKVNAANSDGFRVLTGANNQLRVRHPDLNPPNQDGADFFTGIKLLSSDFDGTTRRAFVNDSQISSSNPSGSVSFVNDDLYIGHSIAFEADAFNGILGEFRLSVPKIDNDLSTEYANQNDPASFYGTPSIDLGGGEVNYTITLDSGNYSLTGKTLSLLSDRNISLENGSYSLTGTDLNLAIQRSLSLSQGIYSNQGTNTNLLLERLLGLGIGAYTKLGDSVGLLADRSLPLGSGAYLKNGSLLGLLSNRLIPLEQGSYDYIGSDINLQYGREFRLSLEQGTYSLQGTEVGLLKDYVLPLETNSYSYTPENISLLASRKINTESGSYSHVGSPISFIYEAGGITYTLSLDSGDYSLTGQSLSLLADRRLPIDFGEYTYEGVNSDLLYNRVVALDSGVYTSAGTDTGLRVNRRLVFQNGNYSLQGTPITLSYTGEVLAILEGYRLSYKKHPVKQIQYKPYNITARYN